MRVLAVLLLLLTFAAAGQQKKKPASRPAKGAVAAAAPADSSDIPPPDPADPADTLDPRDLDYKAWREFAVYSKRGRGKDRRLRLCFQLVSDSSVFNHCINDSALRDPEVFKEVFRTSEGDSTYVLLYVDAFTKSVDKMCHGGHETKLVFFKWNTATNKAKMQQRTIASCVKAITNMSHTDVNAWDGRSPLVYSYHRGGVNFLEVMFDPANYKRGLQYVKSSDQDDD